ncbi:hypothetical protein [Streptomyces laurentii]|uniref:hypothetical protein n=1 Tax=Streptomyces laurentii TaxID=39478 RepID=UPI0036AECBAF
MANRKSDNLYVRQLIWDTFPEHREKILKLEHEEREFLGQDYEVNSYSLVSNVFISEILAPALEENDGQAVGRSAKFIESLLASHREGVLEMASIRITDFLLGFPENWSSIREFAGPNLIEEVSRRAHYYRFDPFVRRN